MTTASTPKATVDRAELGTLALLAWTGDPAQGHDTPYLIAYSLGDGTGGGEAAAAASLALIEKLGLTTGDVMQDHTGEGVSPIQLLVQGGQAVVNMPYMNAQCPVPVEWLAAAERRGHVHFMISGRAWPEARPGVPLAEETLQAHLGNEEALNDMAHVLLPVSQLRR
ncbi:hypothetical protein J7E88_06890 [Streptomyces sp. ISL-10]|uniref:DUF5949 family protein n=1 Tax=Streptomyces sp. ISL-10 TaxID=2819172 RepID=UPI001BEBB5DB|nr:DUF5949 family protein [Streptomyces sp. ISL-10]MBT2365050.1 hypothetical protein [Streptomyces sp. ISL-10]